jgi:hypothetical protein
LVDARDLKSLGGPPPCRFNSGPRHQKQEGVIPMKGNPFYISLPPSQQSPDSLGLERRVPQTDIFKRIFIRQSAFVPVPSPEGPMAKNYIHKFGKLLYY